MLLIKEIMKRKTAKDTKVDGSEMAGPHIAAGKAVSRDYATIDLATLLKMLIAPENEEQSISAELAAATPVDRLGWDTQEYSAYAVDDYQQSPLPESKATEQDRSTASVAAIGMVTTANEPLITANGRAATEAADELGNAVKELAIDHF